MNRSEFASSVSTGRDDIDEAFKLGSISGAILTFVAIVSLSALGFTIYATYSNLTQ